MSTANIHYPDLDLSSQLNLPDVLDFNLTHNSNHPAFVFPNDKVPGTVTKISMLEYIRACHRAGNAVRSSTEPGDVIAIIAKPRHRMIKAGLVPFPISPRNSPAALYHLLKKTSTRKVVTTEATLKNVLLGLREELKANDPDYKFDPSRIIEAPSLQELYPHLGNETANDPFTPIAFPPSPKDTDIAIYLHSSGSTGLPKPIAFTHQIVKDNAALIRSISWDLRKHQQAFKNYRTGAIGLPSFHMMGFCCIVLITLYGPITTAVFSPVVTKPDAVPTLGTPDSVIECAKATKVYSMMSLPTFFPYLIYGGGPLAHSIGENLISHGVHVTSAYGGTEFGVVSKLGTDPHTWMYLELHDLANVRWSPQGDGTFEAQILETERHHMAVHNLEDTKGYATSDVFEPHPTIPNLWKIVGRLDDVIIHSSGEKTVPAPIEAVISASPLVHGAVMFGRQRDQPGILIELSPEHHVHASDDITQLSKLRNLIWPVVEEADKIAPGFSRIYKEMIIFSTDEKPLPRVGKGTIARKAAIALYSTEIDQMYDNVTSTVGVDEVEPPECWGQEDIQFWLSGQITDLLSGKTISPTSDLFEQGFDSLSATILRLRLVSALRKSKTPGISSVAQDITQALVYSHPTIELLSRCIAGFITNPNAESRMKSHEQAIEEMISKYSEGFDAIPRASSDQPRNQEYVLLTGSTGNLGAQMLESLLLKDEVVRVYTLNRPSNRASMLDRHLERFQDKALDVSLLQSSKLVFLEGDTSHEDLSLPQDTLNKLRENLTMIIHNAWRLDFNLSLGSFESHIKGSRILMDIARSSKHASSIRWDARSKGAYPEEVVMDAKYAVGGGYGESKYVTERILAKSGLQATSFRIGQVTGGAPNGSWAITDWVPILVKSSLSIGMLPDAIGVVSWIPMDAVSEILLDVGFGTERPPMAMNVVHPKPIPWTSVMQSLRAILIREKQLESNALRVVPFKQWLAKIEDYGKAPTEEDLKNIPAIKLLDFFSGQVSVDESLKKDGLKGTESAGLTPLTTKNSQRLSARMRTLQPLDESLIEKWVKYWMAAGFFDLNHI
ncbi:putative aminoadipate reductase [Rhodocollybia butyracea]|uniref:Aminoadipate reductase n=1 Tax=Rhodocollybia butyracea TaxID=206335 RepID=A0A9P5U5W5_9AGAR|nr:putative aminoadipate reductase [Rhodocollybia butyracea]